jgi:uncharacterized protein (DUF2336 family)
MLMGQLQQLASERNPESRHTLFDGITSLLVSGGHSMSDAERVLIDNILVDLIAKIEESLRASLAEKLTRLNPAPMGLVRTLARDKIEIARPLIMHHPALDEDDLLDIIDLDSQDHRIAVARRDGIGERVSDALVACNDPLVSVALVNNEGAVISQRGIADLVGQSASEPGLQKALLNRPELSPVLAHRLFWWVGSAH